MAVPFLVVAAAFSALSYVGQAVAFVSPGVGRLHHGRPPRLTCCSLGFEHDDAGPQNRPSRGRQRTRVARTQAQAHKMPLAEEASSTAAEGRSDVVPGNTEGDEGESLLDELLARCAEATKSDAATESSHTGSSEWAGFKTSPELLEVSCRCLYWHRHGLHADRRLSPVSGYRQQHLLLVPAGGFALYRITDGM